jgi:hypothetical protein
MRLSGSYTACSSGEAGRAGSQGGLHTTSGARPGGNRSAAPRRSALQAQAGDVVGAHRPAPAGILSVATTGDRPRRASTAASTPVPVPMSKAPRRLRFSAAGSGACATRSTYSPRTGENTP